MVLPIARIKLFRNSPCYRTVKIYNKKPLNVKIFIIKLKYFLNEKCDYIINDKDVLNCE